MISSKEGLRELHRLGIEGEDTESLCTKKISSNFEMLTPESYHGGELPLISHPNLNNNRSQEEISIKSIILLFANYCLEIR